MLKNRVNLKNLNLGLTLAVILSLTACGGGGSSSNVKILKGVFKDSNVAGLSYISGKQKGITDKNGGFKYEENNAVAFSIGKVALGSGTGKAIMTPLDLVVDGKLNSTEVINKARFLMMLDKDNNVSNGIEISSKVSTKAKSWAPINFASTSFPSQTVFQYLIDASVEDSISHAIPSIETATKHLRTSLLCANSGAYIGSYSGDESGSLALILDPVTGEVKGASYNPANQVSVEVKSTSPIDYDTDLSFISAEDSAKKFTGKFSSSELLGGSWFDVSRPLRKGEFTAERMPDSAATVYRYNVSYIGSDKGVFTFNVDKNNKITGSAYSVIKRNKTTLTGSLNGKSFSAKTSNGTTINGILNTETQSLTGVWSNVSALQTGTFTGGGCRLN